MLTERKAADQQVLKLKKEGEAHRAKEETLKNQIRKITEEINENNASIKALTQSSVELKASMSNPSDKVKAKEALNANLLKTVAAKFEILKKEAPMVKQAIDEAQNAFTNFNYKLFKTKLSNMYP